MDHLTRAPQPHGAPLTGQAPSAPRRGVIAALSGALLARVAPGLDSNGVEAKGSKRGKRKKNKNKNKNKGKDQGGPQTRADATCPGPSDLAFAVGDQARLAQTFTAGASGPLIKAEIPLDRSVLSGDEFILRLSPVDGDGVPTDDVLAAALVLTDDVPGGDSPVTFTFHDPASVEAGVQYALVLVRFAGNFGWLSRVGDVCVGRAFSSNGLSAPFELRDDRDFIFTIFVAS